MKHTGARNTSRLAVTAITAGLCMVVFPATAGGESGTEAAGVLPQTAESLKDLRSSVRLLFDEYMRDPSICLGPEGTYYLTGTTAGQNCIRIWKSMDLKKWEKLDFEWRYGGSPWHKPYLEAKKPLWAPEIHYKKGTFWLTYSMPGWQVGDHFENCGSGLLKSTTGKAEGPYVDVSPDERLGDEIDASLFEDDDGSLYFVWHCGKLRRLKADLSGPAEPMRKLGLDTPDPDPTHHTDLCRMIHGTNSFDHIGYEGAFLLKIDDTYLLCGSDHFEGKYTCWIATSKQLYGPYSSRYPAIPDGGHNMFFKDTDGEWWSTLFNGPINEKPCILPVDIQANGQVSLRDANRLPPPPALPDFHADPHIAVFGDTFYIYPTTDGPGWNSPSFECWSSKDLVHWKSEGIILNFPRDLKWAKSRAWAPCIAARGGKYYFYYSAEQNIGVAVGDRPQGPFRDPLGKPLVAKDSYQCQVIDPMVFSDDDGSAYLYFGNGNCNVVKLNDDMISFDPAAVKRISPPGFGEGSFVIKRRGVYYLMWSQYDTRDPRYCVSYATSSSPLGPFAIAPHNPILAQRGAVRGAGHHSVVQIPGRDEWVIAYHRFHIPGGDGYHRETCLAPMRFDAEGRILKVDVFEGVEPLAP